MTDNDRINSYWNRYYEGIRGTAQLKKFAYDNRYMIRRQAGIMGRLQNLGETIEVGIQGIVSQTDKLFSSISAAFGTRVIQVDRTKEPTFTINVSELYARDQVTEQSSQPNSLNPASALNELYSDPVDIKTAIAIARTAAQIVTHPAPPKTLALRLADDTVAHIQGYSSFEEILAKVEYGFPENELPELFNLLRPRSRNDVGGIEQASEAFACQLFYRASVRLAERSINPETTDGIECDRLLFFALAIKGLRPEVDRLDVFKDIAAGLHAHLQANQYPDLKPINVISIFNRVREPHVTFGLRNATDAPLHEPDQSIAPFVPLHEADEILAEGHMQLGADSKVVPLRSMPRKPSMDDPNGKPSI